MRYQTTAALIALLGITFLSGCENYSGRWRGRINVDYNPRTGIVRPIEGGGSAYEEKGNLKADLERELRNQEVIEPKKLVKDPTDRTILE